MFKPVEKNLSKDIEMAFVRFRAMFYPQKLQELYLKRVQNLTIKAMLTGSEMLEASGSYHWYSP
ncbi:hypothetical protein C6542_25395 [Escherichia coli]|nr:hypothetical protein C5099_15300 [Escherichia coli]EAA3119685.1 hypothetical protein [Escherichia coli]EAC0113456.1 hypothetical protein [Escherichia coli]EEW2487143.1 hypothetical protein [Escherichia coli]EFN8552826.1 hypothetical protein [Escherichia coli]